jgi:hypothetical protein
MKKFKRPLLVTLRKELEHADTPLEGLSETLFSQTRMAMIYLGYGTALVMTVYT